MQRKSHQLVGPGVTVCPLVQVPLSGVRSAESIRDMANLDSWILSAKLPRNIVLSESREKLWASLCSSASAFLDQSPPCRVLYLPISLNNARKKRFFAGPLTGEFPAEIDALDCDTESAIISSITRELNDCYCLHLPSDPSLQRDSESPLLEHGTGRLVLVGTLHTSRSSALLPASLETKFLRLPGQSQTKDGVGNILAAIDELKLIKGDFLYIDLLSNAIFMGTDEDGMQIPPVKDGQKRWHVTGSLTACPKPRIKKILSMFDSLRELVGADMRTATPAVCQGEMLHGKHPY